MVSFSDDQTERQDYSDILLGLSRFLSPWIIKSGYVKPIMCNMGLTVLWCGFGLLFYFKGRWSRVVGSLQLHIPT